MDGRLNNGTWPVVVTASLAVLCVVVGCREVVLVRRRNVAGLWPTFWFITAILLAVMAFGQANNIGDLIADVGRREARSNDWYQDRRSAQTFAVAVVAALWAITALIAFWRVPARRRYLPMALIVFALVSFAAIRVVSLHQIDALLYQRHVRGVEIGRLVELIGLSVAVLMALVHLSTRPRVRRDADLTTHLDDRATHPDVARSASN